MMKDIPAAWQTIWENVKKTAKFIWRHFFTLGILGLLLSIFIKDPLNWKNAFYMTCGAILLDWVKQFIKLTPSPKNHLRVNDQFRPLIPPLHEQSWNSSIRGTPAYFIRNIDSNRYN